MACYCCCCGVLLLLLWSFVAVAVAFCCCCCGVLLLMLWRFVVVTVAFCCCDCGVAHSTQRIACVVFKKIFFNMFGVWGGCFVVVVCLFVCFLYYLATYIATHRFQRSMIL